MTRRNLKEENARLIWRIINLTEELHVIAVDPSSEEAKKIIAKYKLEADRLKEIDLAEQN